jgi:hypothetical protein
MNNESKKKNDKYKLSKKMLIWNATSPAWEPLASGIFLFSLVWKEC